MRYNHQTQKWLVWRDHKWSKDKDGLVVRLAKSVARMRRQRAFQITNEAQQKAELAWAHRSEGRARMEAMIELAKCEYPLFDSGEGWDADPMLLGVANGVVDLTTGILRAGLHADKITLFSPFNFDLSAVCPRWTQFLDEVFGGDQSLISFVQRAIGYSLTGETKEQCLFLCCGCGANGKSTLLEVLRRVLGNYAYNLPFSALELKSRSVIPIDLAAIAGKRLVTAIETNESAQLNEARIKMLTGSDPVTARHLYAEFFTFSPTAKLWLAFNHLPEVQDDSHGFWRRVKLIPFNQRFEGGAIDKDLFAKLIAEAPGILAWAVQGALMWQREGLGESSAIRDATEAYRSESDPVEEFITDMCLVSANERVTASMLWSVFQLWQKENGIHPQLHRRAFTNRLQAKGFKKARIGHDRTWTWFGLSARYHEEPFLSTIAS